MLNLDFTIWRLWTFAITFTILTITNCWPQSTQIQPPSSDFTFCVVENQTCTFIGLADIAYGANNKFSIKALNSPVNCNNATLFDPAVGLVKACFIRTPAQLTINQPYILLPPQSVPSAITNIIIQPKQVVCVSEVIDQNNIVTASYWSDVSPCLNIKNTPLLIITLQPGQGSCIQLNKSPTDDKLIISADLWVTISLPCKRPS